MCEYSRSVFFVREKIGLESFVAVSQEASCSVPQQLAPQNRTPLLLQSFVATKSALAKGFCQSPVPTFQCTLIENRTFNPSALHTRFTSHNLDYSLVSSLRVSSSIPDSGKNHQNEVASGSPCRTNNINPHPILSAKISSTSTNSATTPTRPCATDLTAGIEGAAGTLIIGYRGTFAFGKDGLSDVKFRKLTRILVHGKVSITVAELDFHQY